MSGLNWLTPLDCTLYEYRPRTRPRKLNSAVESLILRMSEDHKIKDIAKILQLNVATVSAYLNRPKREE